MNRNKSIVVVLPTYNGENFLNQQLDSILNQTLKADRILILDDNSTDSTIEILSNYNNISSIEIVANKTNVGVVENLKRAIPLIKSDEYIALADQDDIWDSNKLEIFFKCLVELEFIHSKDIPCIVFSDARAIDEKNSILFDSYFNDIKWDFEKFKLESIFINGGIIGSASMMNQAMFKQLEKLDKSYKIYHDEWFLFISFTIGQRFFIKNSTMSHRKHSKSLTFNFNNPKNTLIYKILSNIKYLLNNKLFLAQRIEKAKYFLSEYVDILSVEDIEKLKKFIALHTKSYFIKKIYIRKHLK